MLVDVGSEKGKELVDGEFEEASTAETLKRDNIRDVSKRKVMQNLNLNCREDKFAEKIEKNSKKDFWLRRSENCMQYGGCNFCCTTCYCNVLNEMSDKKKMQKVLQWDSCHLPGYARVAGGENLFWACP